ncbi:MAG: hypothetical protein ABJB12_11150 [Pseudomonadota bacterium]
MDCTQIREAFMSGASLRNTEMEAHLRGCAHCRELFEHDAALGHTLANASARAIPLQEDLFAALEARVAQEVGLRAWLRSRPTRLRFAVATVSVLLVVTLSGLLRHRPDLAEYPAARLVLLLGAYAIGIVLAFGKELHLSARRGSVVDQLGLLLVALGLPLLIAFAPATEASRHTGPEGALNCFAYGALLTLPTAALLWAFDRDNRPSLYTVCLSAAALGLSANLLLELHCPSGNVHHLLLGHASIGLAWLAAWFALRRLSRA